MLNRADFTACNQKQMFLYNVKLTILKQSLPSGNNLSLVSDCQWFESLYRAVSFVRFGFTGSVPGLPSHDRLLGHGCAQTSEYNPTKTPV